MTAHSVLSPSAAHRWTLCPASIPATIHLPRSANAPAAKGTVQHAMSEACLTDGRKPDSFLGQELEADGFKFIVDDAMVENVQSYVDGINRCVGRRYVEARLDTSEVLGIANQGGTADALILNRTARTIEVHDAKFGFNRVDAEGNKQGLIYIAAAIWKYDIYDDWTHGKFVIHQPAINHYDEFTYTRAEVETFMAEVRPIAKKVIALIGADVATLRANMVPGPVQCQWCPLRGGCPARASEVQSMFDKIDTGSDVVAPMLSDDELGDFLVQLDEIEAWCRDIRVEAYKRALDGKKIKNRKLVYGNKGRRFWKDAQKAEEALLLVVEDETKLYEPQELVSPTVIEKLLKKNYEPFKKYVGQGDAPLQLVPENDKRPGVDVSTISKTDFPEVLTDE